MDKLLYLLPILACPIMMGAMMWMMRGNNNGGQQPDTKTHDDIDQLRAEVTTLREQHREGRRADPDDPVSDLPLVSPNSEN